MQTTQQHPKHRGVSRLREVSAVVLMLVAVPLLASCGGGSDQPSEGGGNAGGQAASEKEGGGGGGGGAGGGGAGGGTGGGGTGADNQGAPITDLRVIISTPNQNTLNGSRARLKGMEVRSVVSDRAFFVGENDAEQLLILNVGEGASVTEGQQVLVAGRLNVSNPNLEERLDLAPEEASAVEEQGIFLRAPRVVPAEG